MRRTNQGLAQTSSGGGTPASTVTGPDTFGAPAVVGTGTAFARDDHDHGLPANPAPAAASTVTGPDNFGDAAVVGTGTAFARNDHNHGLPAAPAVSLTEIESYLGSDVAITSASVPVTALSLTIPGTGTYLIWARVLITAGTNAGKVAIFCNNTNDADEISLAASALGELNLFFKWSGGAATILIQAEADVTLMVVSSAIPDFGLSALKKATMIMALKIA